MPRDVSTTLQDAIDAPGSYKFLSGSKVYPSNVFLGEIDDDFAFPSPDAIGPLGSPVAQDIEYNALTGLVTYYGTSVLKYAIQGNATPVTTAYGSTVKPGVFGGKLFLYNGTTIKRYAIDYSDVQSLSTTPLTEEASITPSLPVLALHAVSTNECVAICNNDSGFTVLYISGTTQILSTSRFMFPYMIGPGVGYYRYSRTMEDMAKFSTGAKLGEKIFAYMSAAFSGMVNGIFYDPATETWSDIYIAIPTDLSVSLCEFSLTNSFVRNDKIYMCGLFNRTDFFGDSVPYALVSSSDDGMVFSIDRFALVSNIGYRFYAHVGTDNRLYLANCNRVSSKPSTWVFDGHDLETSPVTELDMGQIVRYSVTGVDSMEIELKGGEEFYVEHPHMMEGSRIVLNVGYSTSVGEEQVVYGTFIIDTISVDRMNSRSFTMSCIHEGRWRMSGLSMPFYAEITGVSSTYDSMNKETGLLYSAPSNARYNYKFWVDFWQHKEYTNAGESIVGKKMIEGGGVGLFESTGAHKDGFVMSDDLSNILGIGENPEIDGTSLTVKLYGWSAPLVGGQPSDVVNLIMIHTAADGTDEQTFFSSGTNRWPVTWPTPASGTNPITISVVGMETGRRIKNVGLIMQASNSTKYVPWRIEFTNNVKVPITLPETGVTWEKQDDGTFKIPGTGQPFVMFSQKPYNAFNFNLAAKFTNSVIGGIAGYPVAVGLVGLGKDAANFICARFDKVSGKAQLVKIREGAETLLDESAPAFDVGDEVQIQFSHRDGNFKVYIYDDVDELFKAVIDYDWQAADGFLCASIISSLKCGLYGAIQSPMVQILGYSNSSSDVEAISDGVPLAPMEDHSDFPSSGSLRIGTNVYSYGSKVDSPSYVRGPSQLRSMNSGYAPPYGNGMAGLQCRDLNWTGDPDLLTGLLIATDIGYSFISTGTFWTPFNTTAHVRNYITNRSQHYSANKQIGTFPGSLSTRVFVTGGFLNVDLITGEPTQHRIRDYARLELEGTIKCHWFMGAGGEANQTTIQDLARTVAALSGVSVSFPGNFVQPLLTTGSPVTIYEDQYAEGFDLLLEIAAPQTFTIGANIKILPDNYEEKTVIELDTDISLVFTSLGSGEFQFDVLSEPSATVMFSMNYTSGSAYQNFRILFHEKNLSVFQNHRWVTTVTFDELVYADSVVISTESGGFDMLNVVVRDIAELREAVYIDLQTDGTEALQSIIQERPIEVTSLPDGSLQMYYEYTRPSSTLALAPITHRVTNKIPPDAASDAIVYGLKDVKTLQFAPFASILGLSTKLFRFPNLNVGAVEAAIRTLKKSFQRRKATSISCRPQLGPLVGEKLTLDYTIAGINKAIFDEIIIESTSLAFSNSKVIEVSMSINGREFTV